MKRRRTLIISLLLVAALCLGVGYAAVSDTLDIIGNIEADGDEMNETFDGLVFFSKAEVTAKTSTVKAEAKVSDSNTDTATYGISSLKALGDTVTITFTIQNDYKDAVWVTVPDNHEHDTESCISIESSYTAPIKIEGKGAAGGNTATFTITVTLESLTTTDISLNHSVQLSVTDVDPSKPNN